ncbi:hypothetical protein CPB86DRAFT_781467 [Serendipita vermifera]|nr:hypothetical protein CPB86DRAFT_781467 [Serendipita vermifera]
MDIALKHLRNRPAGLPSTQTAVGRRAPLPNLPVEIWLIVIQMALRPSPVIDAEFEPLEIEQAHEYLDSGGPTSDKAAQGMVSRSKRNMRGVCRSWKELVDDIDTSKDRWSWGMSCFEGAPPITDPCRSPRLNQHHRIHFDQQFSARYTYPVSSLILDIASHHYRCDDPVNTTSLKEMISFPENLRVLNIQFKHFNASVHVLKDIEGMSIPLTTLGLHTTSVIILQTSLKIPTLISLFMKVPEYVSTNWNEHPSRFRWSFPSLRNLWWEDQHPWSSNDFCDGHPLFLDIVKDNFNSIRSLRTYPIAREVAEENSSLRWTKMPSLQALATKICRVHRKYHNTETQNQSMGDIRSDSVLYLVVLDKPETRPRNIADELQKYINICKNLQSVYLSGGSFHYPFGSSWWYMGEMQKLHNLCKENSIQIKCKRYDEFVDILRLSNRGIRGLFPQLKGVVDI